MVSQRRRLLLQLRRRIKIRTPQKAVRVSGRVIVYRCLRCGYEDHTEYEDERTARLYYRWHGDRGGDCTGICKVCTKKVRDKRYPIKGVQ